MYPDVEPGRPRRSLFNWAVRLLVVGLLILVGGYGAYIAIVLGPQLPSLSVQDFLRGYERILQPADLRGPPLRTAQGGADRVYVLTTQSERIIPLRFGRVSSMTAHDFLHVDLWAFDPASGQPAWRRRLRTYEDRLPLTYEMLGADRTTLWLFVREPIAVSLRDGSAVADGARLEAINPAMAGKRVDQDGYVAFGGQGLQLTLSDSTQWVVDGETFVAQPRAVAPSAPGGIVMPAYDATSTSQFQVRGLPLGNRWVGVLTDDEAAKLRAEPVVPGAKPGEPPGVMADFLARQHVPGDLTVYPVPYRLWSARVAQVSNAPTGWPADFPDRWGTRDKFSDYQPLPDAPAFLQAGLLSGGRSTRAFFLLEPGSVLVLHYDKVGDGGRLRVARATGPAGRLAWDADLALAHLSAAMFGDSTLAFVGTVPDPAYEPYSEVSRDKHEVLVFVNEATGIVARYDLTAESVVDADAPEAVTTERADIER